MPAPQEFAVVVASWFDGESRHASGPCSFIVRDGRVADIEPGDHSAALLARGLAVQHGAFLMPGLVDAHVHLFLDGATTDLAARTAHLKQPLDGLLQAARDSARQALACGVTLVRDAGDRHGINHRIRAEARLPGSAMAQVRSAGMGIKRAGRYGAFMAQDVQDACGMREAVRALARDSDEIKLILTGIIDFNAGAVTDEPQFTPEETQTLVATASACGRKTFAHCSGAKGLAVAAAAGVGSIEHGFFMSADILRLLAEKGSAWTPTFSPVHFQWAHPEALGWSAQTVGNLRRILDQHAEHLAMAPALGVRLLLGTDAGSMGVAHGFALIDEVQRYLEAGLTLEQTLGAATASARRHFGLTHATLAVGVPFDALLLAQDPWVQLDALRRPLQVWSGALQDTS